MRNKKLMGATGCVLLSALMILGSTGTLGFAMNQTSSQTIVKDIKTSAVTKDVAAAETTSPKVSVKDFTLIEDSISKKEWSNTDVPIDDAIQSAIQEINRLTGATISDGELGIYMSSYKDPSLKSYCLQFYSDKDNIYHVNVNCSTGKVTEYHCYPKGGSKDPISTSCTIAEENEVVDAKAFEQIASDFIANKLTLGTPTKTFGVMSGATCTNSTDFQEVVIASCQLESGVIVEVQIDQKSKEVTGYVINPQDYSVTTGN